MSFHDYEGNTLVQKHSSPSWFILAAGYGAIAGYWLGAIQFGLISNWDYTARRHAMTIVGLSLGSVVGVWLEAALRSVDSRRCRPILFWLAIALLLGTLLLAPLAEPAREHSSLVEGIDNITADTVFPIFDPILTSLNLFNTGEPAGSARSGRRSETNGDRYKSAG